MQLNCFPACAFAHSVLHAVAVVLSCTCIFASGRRHYDKLEHMEEGADKQGQTAQRGTGEPHANGRAFSQEPAISYLTMHSLMNCNLVR